MVRKYIGDRWASAGNAQRYCRDEISLEEKVRLEKEYLDRRSLQMDLKIIAMTFSSSMAGKGVKH